MKAPWQAFLPFALQLFWNERNMDETGTHGPEIHVLQEERPAYMTVLQNLGAGRVGKTRRNTGFFHGFHHF